MIDPGPEDPASAVVNAFITAMRTAFKPDDTVMPPLGGGSTDVRFFAGDDAKAYVDAVFTNTAACKGPFLWVRAVDRFRSRQKDFPNPYRGNLACDSKDAVKVLTVEIGIGRCNSMDATLKWDALENEAEISLSDSWRLEMALERAECLVRVDRKDRAFATDTVAPYGPEGGIICWTGMAYVEII